MFGRPRPIRARFASRVCQLNSGKTPVLMNEFHDPRERFCVPVAPDAEVLRTDAGLGQHRRRFAKNNRRASHRTAAQMHKVPVVREAILTRVLAHRRNRNSVPERYRANFERFE